MPYALLVIGAVLVTASARNTQGKLFTLLKGDFTGSHNFVFWFVSIMVIGAVGYIPKLKPVSTAFLVLVVVVLFLSNRGFFAQFTNQINSTVTDTAVSTGGNNPFGFGSGSLTPLPTLPGIPKFF